MEKPLNIGGQAVIEGVMIRSPNFVTVAVRKKDKTIKVKDWKYISLAKRNKILGLPIIRGVINLFEMVTVGLKAIDFSANEYADDMEDAEEKAEKMHSATQKEKFDSGKKSFFEISAFIVSFLISIALALFLFKFIPLAITEWLRTIWPAIAKYYILFNLIDGAIRIAIFVGYISVLLLFKSFRRIFEYHGAEHMTVHAFERSATLTPEEASKEKKEHPRCGTSFLIIVFVASILIYSFVPRNPVFWLNLAQRIAVIPLIAGVGYEILKWSAKHEKNAFIKLLIAPGVWTQKITTQKPDNEQIEVAIAAVKRAVELEKT